MINPHCSLVHIFDFDDLVQSYFIISEIRANYGLTYRAVQYMCVNEIGNKFLTSSVMYCDVDLYQIIIGRNFGLKENNRQR